MRPFIPGKKGLLTKAASKKEAPKGRSFQDIFFVEAKMRLTQKQVLRVVLR